MTRVALFGGLLMLASILATPVFSRPTYAAAPVITGLWNTGVDASGAKLATGSNDPHWSVQSFENALNGQPHCQQGTPPFPAYVTGSNVQIGSTAQYAWPFSPTDANWVAARTNGWHDNSPSCPDPSDPSLGAGTAQANSDTNTWPRWNYQMSSFTIPNNVDLGTVQLTVAGLVDNLGEVFVNNTKVMDMSANSSNYTSATPIVSAPITGVFVHGANTLRVRVTSGYTNEGLIISQLSASAKWLPTLSISKTVSDATMTVGKASSYTISVKNSGDSDTSDTSGTITVTDVIPNEFTIGTLPAGCSASGQTVTCTTTTVLRTSAANSWDIVIPVTPTKVSAKLTNTAYVTGGNSSNCTTDTSCPAAVDTAVDPGTPNTADGLSLRNPLVITATAIGIAAVLAVTLRPQLLSRLIRR